MNGQFHHPNLNADSSENVKYDFDDFPIYVRHSPLSLSEDYRYDAHFHSDWEFIVVLSGNMQFSIDGAVVTIREGAGLFVNSGHIHFGFSEAREECEYLCLLVHPSLFCTNPFMERMYVLPLMGDLNLPYARLQRNSAAVANIISIVQMKEADDNDYLLKAQTKLFTIFEALCGIRKKNPVREAPKRNFSEMKAMLEFIDVNYGDKITLTEIAASAHVSKNTCISIFRQYVGCTPANYLTNFRLQKSIYLLESTDLSVTEVAYAVGFSGASYFAEIFKGTFGYSPRMHKKKC
ncbi:MAG: AraC family transcriptional regulator [Clostridia bacterium]|nr:AraC family transcriptional regulator [Clostridia bacterium]